MANNYFQFKQFTVHQERSALKVSTDSCLFGAWAASLQSMPSGQRSTILDIGSGTGLLMLMLAQKSGAVIDGIEIDEPSYQQAKENIDASLWKERLQLYHGDVKEFSFNRKYDLIISNPPFYEGYLKSVQTNKNIAKHDEGLTLSVLLDIVNVNLSGEGSFAVLIPFQRTESFLSVAEKENFFCNHLTKVKQSPKHHYLRSMLILSRIKSDTINDEIIIKESDGLYSTAFTFLLSDYYLYL